MIGYPSIDKPWLKHYTKQTSEIPSADMSMYDFLYENAKGYLDYTALNYFGKKVTYKQLFDNIDRTASALLSFGVKKGDIVTLCALNTPEFVYLLYALNKIGAVSNWIGLTSPESDLHEQIASTNSRMIFTVSIAYEQISNAAKNTLVKRIITIPLENSMPITMKAAVKTKIKTNKHPVFTWNRFIKQAESKVETVKINSDDMAMIEYTGGSTGVPKGVMLSNKALNTHFINFYATNNCGIFSFERKDKIISGVPFFLVFGMCACLHSPLCHTMELVLAPDPNPEAGVKKILKSKVNHIMAGRLLIEELLKQSMQSKADLSFVKSILYGGEETNKEWENGIREKLAKFNLNAPLLNSYGMSETAAGVLTAPDNKTDGLIPCANIGVRIIDLENTKNELGYGQEGELCISSEQLMLGYYNDPKGTDEVIFEDDGKRWLKTHDLATISSDGIIKITGRIKRIYSRLTSDRVQVRVYPMRIEEALLKSDIVSECAVVGVKDDILAYKSVAYIIPTDNSIPANILYKSIERYCCDNLPDSHRPDEYIIVDSFPLTRAGKIDYRLLEQKALN